MRVVTPLTEATPEQRAEWSRRNAEARRARRAEARAALSERLEHRRSAAGQLERARLQLSELLDRTEAALAALSPDRPADHRALAATLVAISERLEAMVAAERAAGGAAGGESYEARLRRAYVEAGLAVPGRPGADAT